MSRSKHIPVAAVIKTVIILILGFGVAWIGLLTVPPPAASTRLGFAARIGWPIVHLALVSVLVLCGGLMFRTLFGSVLPQSRSSRKRGRICCWVTLVLALFYAGAVVAVSRDHGKPPRSEADNASQAQPKK
ncbi:MAG TPA: hypothetical protein VMV94_21640 [Phycisphaerae bacterium]|nr:hypothetical protein [Phycisphaerae bacterium]